MSSGDVPRSRLDSCLAPSLKRALTSSSMHTLHSSEYITLSMQNAASLTQARHLQQAANLRARQYYKITWIDYQEDLEMEEEMHDMEALMVKVEGLKVDAEQKEVLQEVLQKDVADRKVEAGALHLLGQLDARLPEQARHGEEKPSVVSLLVKQRDVTSL